MTGKLKERMAAVAHPHGVAMVEDICAVKYQGVLGSDSARQLHGV